MKWNTKYVRDFFQNKVDSENVIPEHEVSLCSEYFLMNLTCFCQFVFYFKCIFDRESKTMWVTITSQSLIPEPQNNKD